MRISVFTVLSSLALVQAKLAPLDARKLKPSDAGAYHTEGFEQLAERYASEAPKSKLDVIVDVSEIAASFCAPGDSLCQSNAYKATLEQFHSSKTYGSVQFPKDFDSRVKKSFSEVFQAIHETDNEDIDSLVNKLRDIEDRIEDLEDVNQAHQVAGLASVSVAIESAKLWHGVYHDESHPLNKMTGYFPNNRGLKQRNLQDNVIAADVEAAINAAINAIDQDITILAVWPGIILAIIPNAYSASVTAAFESSEPEFDGFYFGHWYERWDDDERR